MKLESKIRTFKPSDLEGIISVFRKAVHAIDVRLYSLEQKKVWGDQEVDRVKWLKELTSHFTLVVENSGRVVGFIDMTYQGYIDRLYVDPEFQRKGLARKLISLVLEKAYELELSKVSVRVSLVARHVFKKMGFRESEHCAVVRGGVNIENYKMFKILG